MKRIKESLLKEVSAQCSDNNDDDNDLKKFITNYFNMFDSGFVEKSIQCSMCNEITKEQSSFEELLLYFDQIHHDQNSKKNSCNLGDMLRSYSTDFDSNLERECQACMQRTRTVEKNRIASYPEILCIVLCRSITNEGRIMSSVNFPVENFQPSEYLNDGNDDTTYDLIASVNHHAKPNGGGHYYAICRQNILGQWYKYDDKTVEAVMLIRAKGIRKGIRTVKIEHQRAATILFYKKRSKSTSSVSILSDKDEDEQSLHENSFKSRFSDNGNDDESINSNAEDDVGIGDVRNNSAQATIEEVSIPVISAPIE